MAAVGSYSNQGGRAVIISTTVAPRLLKNKNCEYIFNQRNINTSNKKNINTSTVHVCCAFQMRKKK